MPFRTTSRPVTVGNARFTVYTDGCVRLEYADGGAFSPHPSLLVGQRLARPARAAVERRGKALRIRTARFELHYRDDGQVFSPENLRIAHADSRGRRRVWTVGCEDAGNLGSVTRSLDQWRWCGGPERHPIEGILSTDGGHLLPGAPRVYWNRQHDWPQSLAHRVAFDGFDGYYFAYGNDYKAALRDLVTVFGRIPMVPRWTIGLWCSRWHPYRARELVDLVHRYRRERVPLDVVVIDTDWRDGWGGYDWSRKRFPDPERALARLHELGVRVALNDHPGHDVYESLPEGDSPFPRSPGASAGCRTTAAGRATGPTGERCGRGGASCSVRSSTRGSISGGSTAGSSRPSGVSTASSGPTATTTRSPRRGPGGGASCCHVGAASARIAIRCSSPATPAPTGARCSARSSSPPAPGISAPPTGRMISAASSAAGSTRSCSSAGCNSAP